MEEDGFYSVTGLLASGVYALLRRGRVVYIGQSVRLFARLSGYVNAQTRKHQVKFGPHVVRGIAFDEIWIRPCSLEDLDDLEEALIRKHLPRYNTQRKVPLALNDLIAVLIPAQVQPPKPPSGVIRRRV